jgi:8-oxo-dGTP pyrophosphatase MutT (NUDIX family)
MQHFLQRFVVVVECAIKLDDKYLLIKRPAGVHAAGLLAFPGGKVEYQDGMRDINSQNILLHAVKPEVFEEVGLELIDPLHFITSSYFIDFHTNEHILHVLDVISCRKLEKSKVIAALLLKSFLK